MTDLTAFIAGLPKAELHVHHVGSASPRIVAELAARSDGASPVPSFMSSSDRTRLRAEIADHLAARD